MFWYPCYTMSSFIIATSKPMLLTAGISPRTYFKSNIGIWSWILLWKVVNLKKMADEFPGTAIDKSCLSSCNSTAISAVWAVIGSSASASYIFPDRSLRLVTRVPMSSCLIWHVSLPPRAICRFLYPSLNIHPKTASTAVQAGAESRTVGVFSLAGSNRTASWEAVKTTVQE